MSVCLLFVVRKHRDIIHVERRDVNRATLTDAECVAQDLDNETLMHVDAENRRQTLEEELEFLKQVHEQVGRSFLHALLAHSEFNLLVRHSYAVSYNGIDRPTLNKHYMHTLQIISLRKMRDNIN